MFNKLITRKSNTEENAKKDFKKLANYVMLAKGNRSIDNFAADCKVSGDYMEGVIKAKMPTYPDITFLKVVSDNSQGRVSFKDLTLACGYSNYTNNDLEQIRNIKIERGGIYFCNFFDRGIDSEVIGHRPVLVVQNPKGNLFSSNTKVLAITSRVGSKSKLPTHVFIGKEYGLRCDSIICCELEDTVSKRRLISGSGVVEKIAECSKELMMRVAVGLGKADGYIPLDVPEKFAIEVLETFNKEKTQSTFQYQNNYNTGRQVAFA